MDAKVNIPCAVQQFLHCSSLHTRLVQRLVLALAIVLVPITGITNAERLYAVPMPPDVVSRSVALNIMQHGHRLSMATLSNAYPIEQVLAFYRERWASRDDGAELPGFVEEQAGDWHIISRIEDGWNTVVQMRATATGSEAYLSVMEVKKSDNWDYQPAMPRDAVLVSSINGTEFGKSTQTDVVFTPGHGDETAGFYRRQYSSEGWLIVSDEKIEGSTVMLMQLTGAQAEVVITPVYNGSVAVINQVGK